jgi:hypothetical protein
MNLLVALRKFHGHVVQQLSDTVVGERQDAGDDSGDPLGTARAEGPE